MLDYSYALMDLTAFGRQEESEDSPAGWPGAGTGLGAWVGLQVAAPDGVARRSSDFAQWPRLEAGYSDDLEPRTRPQTPSESLA